MNNYHVINRFNCLILWGHVLFALCLGGYRIANGNYYSAFLALASFLILLLPHIVFALLKLQLIPQLLTLAYLFCTAAFTIGTALGVYQMLPYYDKVVHTLSGVLFSFLGLLLFSRLKPERRISSEELPLAVIFSFSFSMMIAAVWELYEYTVSLLTPMDPQNVLTTGIHDTMLDMLVCLVGAALFIIPELLYFRTGHKDLLMSAYEDFLLKNKDTPEK